MKSLKEAAQDYLDANERYLRAQDTLTNAENNFSDPEPERRALDKALLALCKAGRELSERLKGETE